MIDKDCNTEIVSRIYTVLDLQTQARNSVMVNVIIKTNLFLGGGFDGHRYLAVSIETPFSSLRDAWEALTPPPPSLSTPATALLALGHRLLSRYDGRQKHKIPRNYQLNL